MANALSATDGAFHLKWEWEWEVDRNTGCQPILIIGGLLVNAIIWIGPTHHVSASGAFRFSSVSYLLYLCSRFHQSMPEGAILDSNPELGRSPACSKNGWSPQSRVEYRRTTVVRSGTATWPVSGRSSTCHPFAGSQWLPRLRPLAMTCSTFQQTQRGALIACWRA